MFCFDTAGRCEIQAFVIKVLQSTKHSYKFNVALPQTVKRILIFLVLCLISVHLIDKSKFQMLEAQ